MPRWLGILLSLALVSHCSAQSTADQLNRAWGLLTHRDVPGAEGMARACGAGGRYAPAVHLLLGEIAFQKADFETAESEFHTAVNLNPSLARAWLRLGLIAGFRSYHRSAEVYLGKAHNLVPDNPEILYWWAEAISGTDRVAALEKCLQVMKGQDLDHVERVRADLEVARALGGRRLSRLESPYQSSQIRLERLLAGRTVRAYGLLVVINGQKPVKLLLDTGASGIVLSSVTAARCGVKRLASTRIRGLGDTGALSGYAGLAESVSTGGVHFRDCPVVVSERQSVAGEEGLIGADVFERFLITLDLPAALLRLDPLPLATGADDDGPFDPIFAQELDSFTPLYRMGHLLMIPTMVSDAGSSLFGIDTGSRETLISRKLAARLTNVRKDSQTKLHGLSGQVSEVFSADDLVLEFGGFRAHSINTVSVDLTHISSDMGMDVGGLLGLPVLKLFRIAIDYRDGLVKFEYVPSAAE